ncbi:hypothetical protein HGRIS_002984 [Hohenbuehelia grisea]|uniref:Helicase C-terminal domain-containing protein n=1 Tax=Hohenbuehelia grisea TaxID=104357 RepID=A0ABR3JP91_9AGAR
MVYCPTWKKMLDFGGPNVFSASAFHATDEELTNYARGKGKVKVYPGSNDEGRDIKPKVSQKISSSSDDDMPEVSMMFAPRPKKKVKKNVKEEDDILDLTMDVSPCARQGRVWRFRRRAARRSARQLPCSRQIAQQAQDDDGDGPSKAALATWRKGDDDMEASTKMLAPIEFLKGAVDDKTIMDVDAEFLEALFSRHGIQSLRYDGSMDRSARDDTLARFRSAGGPKVILISTKCGGVGLNLVSVNRVVHANSLAEVALGEGTGAKLHKLSVKDIKLLFGMKTAPEPASRQSLP